MHVWYLHFVLVYDIHKGTHIHYPCQVPILAAMYDIHISYPFIHPNKIPILGIKRFSVTDINYHPSSVTI